MAKQICKRTILLFISSILLASEIYAQNFTVECASDKASSMRQFNFKIINASDTNRVYSIALEIWNTDRGWFETKSDIFNYANTKKTRNFKISAHQTKNHFFYPNRLKSIAINEKYRLKILYGLDYTKKNNIIYSQKLVFK
jgi:hypothetical protein